MATPYDNLTIEPGGMPRFTRADHFELGDRGEAARELNLYLIAAGYLTPKEVAKNGGADVAGTGTMNAIQYMRRDRGLPDGGRNVTADDLRFMRSVVRESGAAANAEAYTGNAGGYLLVSDFGPPSASAATSDASGISTTAGAPSEEVATTTGIGTTTTILTSADMKWYFDKTTGKWLVSYKLPNSDRAVVYEATGSQMDAIFGNGKRPTTYDDTMDFAAITQQEGVTFGGDITEVEGKGTFEAHVEATIARGLDEGHLPDWAKDDPAVMDIIFLANAEGKSEEWMLEQIYKLDSFKKRFPGIDALTGVGLTTTEAVTGFLEMESGVKQLVLADGGKAESVTPEMVGGLLAQGHSLTDVQKTFDTFDRMGKNAGALDAFNKVLEAHGMKPLDADGQFEFMAGNAPKEMYDIWEQSSLTQAAAEAGLGLSVADTIDLARRTEGLTSYEAAYAGMTDAAQKLLQYRSQIDLQQYGLNEQDLIDISLGVPPSSGVGQADIARGMERAVRSSQAQAEKSRVNPFRQFNTEGVPQAASLSRSSAERA
jgi:hypothetical protein